MAASWFENLAPELRAWLRARMAPLKLDAGATLCHAGDESDCMYLVTRGALGAFARGDEATLLGQIVAGETVGELGLIMRSPRSATVRALRDSALLKLSFEAFDAFAREHPDAVMSLARVVFERAQRTVHHRLVSRPRTLALLPQDDGLHVEELAQQFQQALGGPERVAVVRRADAPTDDALDALEHEHAHVIYVAEPELDAWRRRCLRQADALLFVTQRRAPNARWAELNTGVAQPLPRPEHLLLLHEGKVPPGSSAEWVGQRAGASVHHLRGARDVPRIARLVTGTARGIVLSGGGARGFAHLGVLRALNEAGVTIDVVGGASIGAIIGAGYAADWSIAEMTEVYRSSFLEENPLSDWTVPFVSLVAGRAVTRLLKDAYGKRDIEDLVRPFFCVSTSLTHGRTLVHRRGPVWKWLRASAAIPGVLPPVFSQGQVLVDGGVMNNLPVDVMRESRVSEVIAVDIGADDAVKVPGEIDEFELPPLWKVVWDWVQGLKRPSLPRLMLGSGMVNAGAATIAARAASSLVLTPPVGDIDLLNWDAFDLAIERGYESTLRALEKAS